MTETDAEYKQKQREAEVVRGTVTYARPKMVNGKWQLQPLVRKQKKIGRNEQCPCGSGDKFKKCCGF